MNEQPKTDAAQPPRDADGYDLAASLASDPATQPQPRHRAAPGEPAERRGGGRAALASAFALLLALIATTVAGFLWWQYRQFYVSLDQTDAETALALERVRAELRALQDDVESAGEALATERRAVGGLSERVDQLPGRLGDIERRLNAVQGGSFDAREDWLRAETEYYLTVANTELLLAGRWENAIRALELADGRLVELGNPALAGVRNLIAGELQALRAVRLPDIEGLSFSLDRLARRVEGLPLRADAPVSFVDRAEPGATAEPGLQRLWQSLRNTLAGLVRIERRDEPVAPALTAAEKMLRRRQLELELNLARMAALRGQQESFQASLRAAVELLRQDFDVDSAQVDGAIALLTDMQAMDLDPPRPDISGSLNLLRGAAAGSN
jgi:uncharacterized protein HemX